MPSREPQTIERYDVAVCLTDANNNLLSKKFEERNQKLKRGRRRKMKRKKRRKLAGSVEQQQVKADYSVHL